MQIDSHIHIVGCVSRWPLVAGAKFTPPPATVAQVKAIGAPLGVTRFVIVQPSFYGTDNSVLLAALDELAGDGRGVAVIDAQAIDPASLDDMHRRGVRGLRINLYSTLATQQHRGLDAAFAAMADVAARMGWHVEVLAALPVLVQHAGLLAAAPCRVVIDHYALYAGHLPGSPEGLALLGLLGHDNIWLKLSAPYRTEPDPLATRPALAWLTSFLEAAEERCVWGSDWPHTPPHEQQTGDGVHLPYRTLDYAEVVAGFRASVGAVAGDPSLAEQIMTTNAARLYGFE